METRSGFVADKVAMKESDGGLGLKLQRTESLPYKMTMHHRRPFSISESGGGSSSSSGGGPTFYNGCEEGCRLMSDIYDVVGGVGSIARTLQPFNTSAFKSPGGMAASLRFPFTSAQLQELERQALIYKYMMASVPVPPDLLIPISRSLTDSTISHSNLGRSSSFSLRFSNSTDPEPGRCRRTDGKKWRCSRDVAPDQKYCERHMHRGRPRSRKPVEVHSEIKDNTRTVPHTTTTTASVSGLTTNTSRTSSHHLGATKPYPFGLFSKPDYKASPFETMVSASSYKDSSMNWMMKGETVPLAASNQQVQQLMHSRLEMNNTKNPVFQNCYEESLNLNSFEGFSSRDGSEVQGQNDQCCLFLNPELASLEVPLSSNGRQTPKHFIDAWSTAATDHTSDVTGNKSSVSSNGKLPLSSLTLSMSDGSDNMDQIQMGLGVIDSDRDNNGVVKPQPLSWMTPVSWMTSPPGGPLGEVLQSSNTTAAAAGSNATSPRGCSSSISRGSSGGAGSGGGGGLNFIYDGWGGGSSSEVGTPRATNVSSPSGVLQKTLASLSDSSGGSSPTFNAAAAAAAKSEIALQWLNHSKLPSSS